MKDEDTKPQANDGEASEEGSLNDMLQELRILLQGAQVLTALLIILPFNQGFEKIHDFDKWVYTATFLCSITSLVFFSAPAAHHRLARPLMHRELFKTFATRMILVGLVVLSFALILVTQLVVSQVIGSVVSIFVTAFVGLLILIIWWLFPLTYKERLYTGRQLPGFGSVKRPIKPPDQPSQMERIGYGRVRHLLCHPFLADVRTGRD